MNQSSRALGSGATDRNTAPTRDVVAMVNADGRFTIISVGIEVAGLTDALAEKGPFTVFAPTDAAFGRLPAGAWDRLLKDPAKLRAILNYHVVPGYFMARHMKSGDVMTLQGSSLTMAVSPAEVKVNEARVTEADLAATNGIVHSIDAVILPRNWRLPATAVSCVAAG